LEQIGLLLLAGTASAYDLHSRRIPNWLCLAGLAGGIAWNAVSPEGAAGWASAVQGAGVGFGIYLPLYAIRARGAGDVKLLAALGAVAGPSACLRLFVYTAIAGGVMGLVLVAAKGRLRRTLFNIGWILNDLIHLRAPYRSSAELDVRSNEGVRLPHALSLFAGVAALIYFAG
jgi:prepilin peptidase CpaA